MSTRALRSISQLDLIDGAPSASQVERFRSAVSAEEAAQFMEIRIAAVKIDRDVPDEDIVLTHLESNCAESILLTSDFVEAFFYAGGERMTCEFFSFGRRAGVGSDGDGR